MTIKSLKRKVVQLPLIALVCLAILSLYFLVLWPGILVQRSDGLYAGHAFVWADWSLHLSLATIFATQPPGSWFDSLPVYAGVKLNYPFLMNMISGFLMRLGASLPVAFLLPAILCTLATLLVWFRWGIVTLQRSWLAGILVVLMVCSGGLGFLYGGGFTATLLTSNRLLTQLHDYDIEFTNIFIGMLIPQRAFLLGALVASLIILFLYRMVLGNVQSRYLWGAGVLAGLLPIIHLHTFFVVGLVSVWLFLWTRSLIRSWVQFGIPAVLLSVPLYLLFQAGTRESSYLPTINWGWYVDTSVADWILFWVKNWGVYGIVAALGTGLLFSHRQWRLFAIASSWWVVFLWANIVQMQPQSWDNSKLLAWSYLGLALPVGYVLSLLLSHKRVVGGIVAMLIVVSSMLSGGLDLLHLLDRPAHSYRMYSTEEQQMAPVVIKRTADTDVFLTTDFVINPVSALTGRTIFSGYPGWLFNYSLPYREREEATALMYQGGDEAARLLAAYGIDYVVISEHERKYDPDEDWYASQYPRLYESPTIRIYAVSR